MDWFDTSYLQKGNAKQKHLYMVLKSSNILNILSPFKPALVSTICIGINIETSDADIICSYTDKQYFINILKDKLQDFSLVIEKDFVLAKLFIDNIVLEIYASNIPTEKQNAYLHLTAMHKILSLSNEILKDKIIALKKTGIKFEPAFCRLLYLTGNPYKEMLKIAKMSNDEIKNLIPLQYINKL